MTFSVHPQLGPLWPNFNINLFSGIDRGIQLFEWLIRRICYQMRDISDDAYDLPCFLSFTPLSYIIYQRLL